MARLLRVVVVWLSCIALVACTSLQVVADGREASSKALQAPGSAYEPNDVIVVTTTDGRRLELRITSIGADTISGTVAGATEPVTIPIAQIERIERNRADKGKSLGLVVAYVAIGLLLGYALGKALSGSVSSGK